MDRSKLFHKHESDAVMVIRGANNKFKGETDPTIITAIEATEKRKKKRGRPPLDKDKKTKNVKRIMLYVTEEEYDTFRQYAFDARRKMSDYIVACAKRAMGKPRKPKSEYIGVDDDIEENDYTEE